MFTFRPSIFYSHNTSGGKGPDLAPKKPITVPVAATQIPFAPGNADHARAEGERLRLLNQGFGTGPSDCYGQPRISDSDY